MNKLELLPREIGGVEKATRTTSPISSALLSPVEAEGEETVRQLSWIQCVLVRNLRGVVFAPVISRPSLPEKLIICSGQADKTEWKTFFKRETNSGLPRHAMSRLNLPVVVGLSRVGKRQKSQEELPPQQRAAGQGAESALH